MGMKERISYCHGSISIAGKKNQGTTVEIRIPILKKQQL
jgi:signal transduction histidine kinase